MDAVEIYRLNWMFFVNGQELRRAVDLPRARIDDANAGIPASAFARETQLCRSIDCKVSFRKVPAMQVTYLTGEIENNVSTAHRMIEPVRFGNVGVNYFYVTCD